MKGALRWLGEATPWLRLALLAVVHAVILYGLFERDPRASAVARYLEDWLIAEIVALVVTPYLMMLTVRNHERALWERLLWLPAALIVLAGASGSVRLLQATWFYVLTCLPVLWIEHTATQASLGCARGLGKMAVLVVLMGVFGNRPLSWPIGTLAGKWMTTGERILANAMACAVAYYAIAAVGEYFLQRAGRDSSKASGPAGVMSG